MTLLVRNEEDIIRENIEFHLAQGVNFFIVTDNLSADGTREILKSYEKRGVLQYRFEASDQFDQHLWVTQMAASAFEEYGADWVINNDADEFWWPRSGTLIDALSKISEKYNVIEAQRSNFVMVDRGDLPFYQRMIYRTVVSLNSNGKPLPSKVAHRGNAKTAVAPGNHDVSGFNDKNVTDAEIDILHFPMRSYKQFENKIRLGGAAYERNSDLPRNIGSTWRNLYAELRENGHLQDYFAKQKYKSEQIKEGLSRGLIVEDRRLLNYLEHIL